MRRVILCLTLLALIAPGCDNGGTITPAVASITPSAPNQGALEPPETTIPTLQTAPSPASPSPAPTLRVEPTRLSSSQSQDTAPDQTAPASSGLPVGELLIAGLQAIQLIGAPQSSDSFYALTPTGLYLTRDGGLTWVQVTPAPQQDSFVFSRTEPGTLYAGDGADCYRGGPDQTFYKSVNGGATWSELPSGVNLRPLAVHSADPNRIWAIGCAGPAHSSDGGETWTDSHDDLFLLYDVTHVVPSPDWSEIYIAGVSEGGSGLVAGSWDGGQSWIPLLQESPEHVLWWINDLQVLTSEAAPSQLFLADPHSVWRSRDGGATWQASSAGLQDVVYRDGADFTTIGINALAVDHNSTPPTVYLGTAQGVYQSLDAGETWTKLTGGPWENAPILDLALRPTRLLITSDQGVFVFEL